MTSTWPGVMVDTLTTIANALPTRRPPAMAPMRSPQNLGSVPAGVLSSFACFDNLALVTATRRAMAPKTIKTVNPKIANHSFKVKVDDVSLEACLLSSLRVRES